MSDSISQSSIPQSDISQVAAAPLSEAPDAPGAQSERVVAACDIATGAARDPDAVAVRTKGSWRDLNCKGNGTETYRRALSPGGSWRFVAEDRLPRGAFLASDRKAIVRGDVFAGDLVANYERSLRGGASRGEAAHDGKIGLVVGPREQGGADIEWMDVVRQKNGTWRVVLPTGAHLTFPSAAWR
jgi:hypothetical protein